MNLLSVRNPNPNLILGHTSLPTKRGITRAFSPTVPCLKPSCYKLAFKISPAVGFNYSRPSNLLQGTFLSFAASHEESKNSDIDVEKEKNDIKESEESQEAWEQTLASIKEQALKMKSVSQEAYEVYSKKALILLEETSEKLKIHADKARNDLTLLAKELSVEGREYLVKTAENSPEPVREVVETFSSSADDLNDISKFRDFHLGIPYGLFLSAGGFLSFMLTGSISAIRFGVILGGALLALSISSLRSYRRGEINRPALKGQTAIAAILFLRELLLLIQRPPFFTIFTTALSGAMFAFYVYKIITEGKQSKGGREFEPGTDNRSI